MSISAASFNKVSTPQINVSKTSEPKKISKPMPAGKMALASAALWGTMNFGVDKLFSKLLKYESKTSTSLMFSAAIALIMGIITYNKVNKINKQDVAKTNNSLSKIA